MVDAEDTALNLLPDAAADAAAGVGEVMYSKDLTDTLSLLRGGLRSVENKVTGEKELTISLMKVSMLIAKLRRLLGTKAARTLTEYCEQPEVGLYIVLGAKSAAGGYNNVGFNTAQLKKATTGTKDWQLPVDVLEALAIATETDVQAYTTSMEMGAVPSISPSGNMLDLPQAENLMGDAAAAAPLAAPGLRELDALKETELRALCARLLSSDASRPLACSGDGEKAAGGAAGAAGGRTRAQGPGTASALTALLPKTFDLASCIRDLVKPISERTVSELDADGNVQRKLTETWPATITLLQFLTATQRCKNTVYVDVQDDYQLHVDNIVSKWDDNYGTENLLKYDKAMRQRYVENPELGFPTEDSALVFKYLFTPNLFRNNPRQDHDGPVAGQKRMASGPANKAGAAANGGGATRPRQQPSENGCWMFGRHGGSAGCDGCTPKRPHFCLACNQDYGYGVSKCPVAAHKGNICTFKPESRGKGQQRG